eukprot:gnl/Spiro4/16130_TR8671_c0_g1_i1.p1 gnl/Spiro4/16130_TR8671_c0_g1~~gnl/Spiro4/16130_TR8671_c0_g1_i1.p1  ORF type:complete len:120 (-),score=4.66 gnl/Spiro4/16130_TR8671_c0_g1_i1:159-518(-)
MSTITQTASLAKLPKGGKGRSGISKSVLQLYRAFLKAARAKSPEHRKVTVDLIRSEFKRHKSIPIRNFDGVGRWWSGNTLVPSPRAIEHLLWRGRKQLANLEKGEGIKTVFTTTDREPS